MRETFRDEVMEDSVQALSDAVIGRRIVSAESVPTGFYGQALVLTLDDGTRVRLVGSGDCCAYTELEKFLLRPDSIDHAITGVSTNNSYTTWHVYAAMGDVLELDVAWSEGSGYYAYGFDLTVEPAEVTA